MGIAKTENSMEVEHSQIYLRIPVTVMLRHMERDPDLHFPVMISYRTNSRFGNEWQCSCIEDFEHIIAYFYRMNQMSLQSYASEINIYRIGKFREQLYIEIANGARMVVERSDFPELAGDSILIDQNSIAEIYNQIKKWDFDRRKISGKVIHRASLQRGE